MGWDGPWGGSWAGPWGGGSGEVVAPPEGAVALPADYTVALVGEAASTRVPGEPALIHMHRTQYDTIAIAFQLGGLTESIEGAPFTLIHEALGTSVALGDADDRVTFAIDETAAALEIGRYAWVLVINDGAVGSEQTVARGRDYVEARELDA